MSNSNHGSDIGYLREAINYFGKRNSLERAIREFCEIQCYGEIVDKTLIDKDIIKDVFGSSRDKKKIYLATNAEITKESTNRNLELLRQCIWRNKRKDGEKSV